MLHSSVSRHEPIQVDRGSIISPGPFVEMMPQPGSAAVPPRRRSPLPKWRLRRVEQHIAAHLEATVTLADLAGAAGLSPMHFAAQFRVATGLRPHEFLLRSRIDHARRLLADPRARLVDVALAVGFQTQAHFTTVFKRIVGETPHRWRYGENADEGARVEFLQNAQETEPRFVRH